MSKIYNPIPSVIRDLMQNETLEVLDIYINPTAEGAAFHQYTMQFIKKLNKLGIYTCKQLHDATKDIDTKTSKFSFNERKLILGHNEYINQSLVKAEVLWKSLTEEQRSQAIKDGYCIEEINN